eukprot:m51a1_g11128 hypothetical protein (1323) ;mRNA; f:132232-146804
MKVAEDEEFLAPDHCGTTACCLLLVDGVVHMANAGDSRYVLCRSGERIIAAGCEILSNYVEGRKDISRTIGGISPMSKEGLERDRQPVIAMPQVLSLRLSGDDEFAVLCSDGITDCLANWVIVSIARPVVRQAPGDSEALRRGLGAEAVKVSSAAVATAASATKSATDAANAAITLSHTHAEDSMAQQKGFTDMLKKLFKGFMSSLEKQIESLSKEQDTVSTYFQHLSNIVSKFMPKARTEGSGAEGRAQESLGAAWELRQSVVGHVADAADLCSLALALPCALCAPCFSRLAPLFPYAFPTATSLFEPLRSIPTWPNSSTVVLAAYLAGRATPHALEELARRCPGLSRVLTQPTVCGLIASMAAVCRSPCGDPQSLRVLAALPGLPPEALAIASAKALKAACSSGGGRAALLLRELSRAPLSAHLLGAEQLWDALFLACRRGNAEAGGTSALDVACGSGVFGAAQVVDALACPPYSFCREDLLRSHLRAMEYALKRGDAGVVQHLGLPPYCMGHSEALICLSRGSPRSNVVLAEVLSSEPYNDEEAESLYSLLCSWGFFDKVLDWARCTNNRVIDPASTGLRSDLERIEKALPPPAPVLFVATLYRGRVLSERLHTDLPLPRELLQRARLSALAYARSIGGENVYLELSTQRTADGTLVAARIAGNVAAVCALASSAEDAEAEPVLRDLYVAHSSIVHPILSRSYEPPPHARVTCARTGTVLVVRDASVRALVTESGARVAMELTVANEGPETAEAFFALPLPAGAAVVAFGARTDDGQELVGELHERGAAQAVYDDAIAGGSGAALLEHSGDGLFTAALGSLLGGHRVTLSVAWVGEVSVLLGRRVSFTLPTSALPQPARDNGAGVVGLVGVEGTVSVDCDMRGSGRDIEDVACPSPCSWDVRIAREGPQRASVSLVPQCLPQGDLCVCVELTQSSASRAVVERNPATNSVCVMAALRVPNTDALVPRTPEVVFVVDRSGSMQGRKIEQVQDALRLFLSSLPVGSLFNIYVDSMKADMEGTNLWQPLQVILADAARSDVRRLVFVVTDGLTEFPNETYYSVCTRSDPSRTTLFVLGIGDDCCRPFLQCLADASAGLAEFVEGSGRIEPIVMRLLASALRHSATSLNVLWPTGLSLQLSSPALLPRTVVCGEIVQTYAVVEDSEDLRGKCVALTGIAVGSAIGVSEELSLDEAVQTEGSLLHTICARQYMRDRSGEQDQEVVRAVATRFGLASPHTSFVVVERRVGAAQEGSLVQGHLGTADSSAVIDPRLLDALLSPEKRAAALSLKGDAALSLEMRFVLEPGPRSSPKTEAGGVCGPVT